MAVRLTQQMLETVQAPTSAAVRITQQDFLTVQNPTTAAAEITHQALVVVLAAGGSDINFPLNV